MRYIGVGTVSWDGEVVVPPPLPPSPFLPWNTRRQFARGKFVGEPQASPAGPQHETTMRPIILVDYIYTRRAGGRSLCCSAPGSHRRGVGGGVGVTGDSVAVRCG